MDESSSAGQYSGAASGRTEYTRACMIIRCCACAGEAAAVAGPLHEEKMRPGFNATVAFRERLPSGQHEKSKLPDCPLLG